MNLFIFSFFEIYEVELYITKSSQLEIALFKLI